MEPMISVDSIIMVLSLAIVALLSEPWTASKLFFTAAFMTAINLVLSLWHQFGGA